MMDTTLLVEKKPRINLALSPRSRQEVAVLSASTNRSVSELVRLALSVLKALIEEHDKNHKLIVTTADGTPIKEIVIPGI